MAITLESDAYFQTVSILNDILYDEGISIVDTEGKTTVYITLECDGAGIQGTAFAKFHLFNHLTIEFPLDLAQLTSNLNTIPALG